MCVALILALPLPLSYHLFSHLAGPKILEGIVKSLEDILTFKTATYLNININTQIKSYEGKCHHTVYMYTGCFSRELNYEC